MQKLGKHPLSTESGATHTEMALRMQADKRYSESMDSIIAGSAILQKDIAAYKSGDLMTMLGHIAGNYDYSKDYWRLTQDGELVNDGQGWLRDVDGKYINIDGTRTDNPIEGKTLGAKGIETGLLNILYGGTSGRRYDDFSVEQQINSHLIMEDAKIGSYYANENFRGIKNTLWDKTAKNPLDMDYVMTLAGKTIAAPVFARYYDSTVDANITKNESVILENATLKYIPDIAKARYNDLYNAKFEFYKGAGGLFESTDTKISGPYGDYIRNKDGTLKADYLDYYKSYNNLHYGIDIYKRSGSDNILLGLSGTVVSNEWNSAEGWTVCMEYGYNFESSFIGVGLYGEYGHLREKSDLLVNTSYQANQTVGLFGDTGKKSTGPHLHYSMYTQDSTYYSQTTIKILLGNNYKTGSMYNGSWRTVYDPTNFYNQYKLKRRNVE